MLYDPSTSTPAPDYLKALSTEEMLWLGILWHDREVPKEDVEATAWLTVRGFPESVITAFLKAQASGWLAEIRTFPRVERCRGCGKELQLKTSSDGIHTCRGQLPSTHLTGQREHHQKLMGAFDTFAKPYLRRQGGTTVRSRLLIKLREELQKTDPQ